jgi:hypothetical protein
MTSAATRSRTVLNEPLPPSVRVSAGHDRARTPAKLPLSPSLRVTYGTCRPDAARPDVRAGRAPAPLGQPAHGQVGGVASGHPPCDLIPERGWRTDRAERELLLRR